MVTAEYERPGGRDGQQLLVELAARTAAAAVDTEMWQAWLADPDTRRRFGALVYRRGHDHCSGCGAEFVRRGVLGVAECLR